ncbi:MAG: ABC transporter substrate-binding protein [Microbacteriaceae bacterium]|nr:ABC transporter substrate-binding protein [Microbacteriaceae bacterium]
MKTSRIGLGVLALATAGSLALAGCASGDSGSGDGAAATGGIITVNGTEPQKGLIPADTTEVGGGKVVDALFEGLTYYDAEGTSHMAVAESIEPNEDRTVWTIKLREDAVFSDGTPVQAHNFVDAWNYSANIDNAMGNQYFFYPIKGWSDAEPVESLEGLTIVDDYTFTVEATPDFPDRLGYSSFYPLPDVAFEDMEAFGQSPIGNGSYVLDGADAWKHDVEIKMVKSDTYVGPREAQNDGLTVIMYASLDAAYTDVQAGNLDIIDQIPESALSTFVDDFGDRAVNQTGMLLTTLTISQNLPHFAIDEEGILRRQALSLATDREEITEVIFKGTNLPSRDFSSSAVDGYNDNLEGVDVLEFDPEKAQELWAQADAISPWEGTLPLATNGDGPPGVWIEALANQWMNTLGITVEPKLYPTFAAFLEDRELDVVGVPFHAGWQADYPGMYNFLAPLYATGASSTHGFYSNAEFDALLETASRTGDRDEQVAALQAAQEILLAELPSIPLWNQATTGAYNESLSNVAFGWNSVPIFYEIVKN